MVIANAVKKARRVVGFEVRDSRCEVRGARNELRDSGFGVRGSGCEISRFEVGDFLLILSPISFYILDIFVYFSTEFIILG